MPTQQSTNNQPCHFGMTSTPKQRFFTFAQNNNIRSKAAFTLAEVLITLGIIGIVSALTIPMLISKFHEIQYRVTYKKTYSSLNQLMKYLQEDDAIDLSLGATNVDWGQVSSQVGVIFKYMSNYYNAKTTCFNGNVEKCWVCDTGEAGYIYNGAPDWLGCNRNSYAFIDASGVSYYLYSINEYPLLIDVNGFGKPNQLGRDRFVMLFANSLEPGNTYPDFVDTVLPLDDIISKTRWCPQGNCLYKSWIRNGR